MKKIIVGILVTLFALVLVGLLVVFFLLNSIVKKGVETAGPMITKVDVKLGSATISPFSGSGELSKLFVGNPDGYKSPSAMQVEDMKVGVSVGSVFADTIVVNEIKVKSAEITLEGSLSANNLTKIMDNVKGTGTSGTNAGPVTPSGKPKKFIVKDIDIEGTKVNLVLNLPGLGNKTMTIPLPPLHLQNIGQAENGVTADELVQAIMKPLLASVTSAATDAISNMAGQLKDLGKGGADSLQKAGKGVTDLFKK